MPSAERTLAAAGIFSPGEGSSARRSVSALDPSVSRKATTLAELINRRVSVPVSVQVGHLVGAHQPIFRFQGLGTREKRGGIAVISDTEQY